MQLIDRLNDIISEFGLLKHHFYQAWSRGELSKEILQRYAAQYYHQVDSFPRFLALVYARCPEQAARNVLAENFADEVVHGTPHPVLWRNFAKGLGVHGKDIDAEVPLAETREMVDTYYQLAEDWRDGLCALYAYESQVPDVSTSKIAGLKQFYGIDDDKTLEFFTAHQTYDVGHSNQVAKLIEQYVEPAQAEKATRKAARSLSVFLDGMCHLGGITC
jgi:pyrroloquinoline-quinone synthase